MAAISTHKRRPVAPTADTQKVTITSLPGLKPEKTVEAYHQLFVNIELLMSTMLEHGVYDEVITMINAARIAQRVHSLEELDRYLEEIVESVNRWNTENAKVAKTAESERYSPEATVSRFNSTDNPRRLRPPDGGGVITLRVTARLSSGLLPSSAALLRAEQVYGPFWSIKARCFVVPRGTHVGAAQAFLAYRNANPKFAKRDFRLLTEYRLAQSQYANCDIYMLVDLPRLMALRDTKILELGIATKSQLRVQNIEESLPIIDRAKAIIARLPTIVSADSREYIKHRLVEAMLLQDKRDRLRKARYGRDGEPRGYTAASSELAYQRFRIAREIAEMIRVPPEDINKAMLDRNFSNYQGMFFRQHGRVGWEKACILAKEWKKLKRLSEI